MRYHSDRGEFAALHLGRPLASPRAKHREIDASWTERAATPFSRSRHLDLEKRSAVARSCDPFWSLGEHLSALPTMGSCWPLGDASAASVGRISHRSAV